MHRWLRILSTSLVTAGVVVLLDAGLTLIWQEPLSAAYSAWQQSRAAHQLDELEAGYPKSGDLAAIRGVQGNVAKAKILSGRFRHEIHIGEAIGRMKIDRMHLNIVLMQGTDTSTLQKGPGHYPATKLPGQGGTIGVAGHRTTYLAPFRHIDSLQKGDLVRIEMPYADFTYRVFKHRIVLPTQVGIVHPVGFEELVMTACNPLYSAAQRYAVFSKLISITNIGNGGGK